MKAATKKALIRLKELRGGVESALFDRIDLCKKVLGDWDWIDANHGGDEFVARDHLEGEFFPDLKGFIGLGVLLDIFGEFPDRDQWAEQRFSLQAMHALWRERCREEAMPQERKSYKPLYEESEAQVKELVFERDQLRKQIDRQSSEMESERKSSVSEMDALRQANQELREQMAELRGENRALRERVAELEKLLAVNAA